MAQLYSNLKFLRYPDRIQALREGRMAAPVHVRIKPTNLCNHHCWYCAYKADGLQLGSGMSERDQIPPARMAEIADDLVAMGVAAVTFSGGGEPLLYKPLPETVARLAVGGVKVAAITNGHALQGRVAEAFARHGSWVRVSMDGWDDASYCAARGLKGAPFTRILENMRAFVASGTHCVLGVSFIVSQHNHTHLREVARELKGVGVNHVKFSGVVVGNSAAENNRYHAAMAPAVGEAIRLARAELADETFAVIDHYHELDDLFHKDYTLCPYLMFLTVIGADLGVYTCQDKAYTDDGRLGSLRERRFRDFWFSEENRARVFGFDPSRRCPHHCITHPKNLVLTELLNVAGDHGAFV